MKVDVTLDNVTLLTEYIEDTISEAGAPMSAMIKMNIALDEIFSNIVKFSGASYADITCSVENSSIYLVFEDDGTKYNPLEKADPDTNLTAEERDIGGLGIFMVKKSMTDISYEFKDGKNILSLKLDF